MQNKRSILLSAIVCTVVVYGAIVEVELLKKKSLILNLGVITNDYRLTDTGFSELILTLGCKRLVLCYDPLNIVIKLMGHV